MSVQGIAVLDLTAGQSVPTGSYYVNCTIRTFRTQMFKLFTTISL